MTNPSSAYMAAFLAGAAPVKLAIIETVMGWYVYGEHLPTDIEIGGFGVELILDGSLLLDGSTILGSGKPLIDRGARVLNWPDLEETLTPVSGDVFGGLTGSEQTDVSLTLSNSHLKFSELLAVESFLAASLELRFGFRGLGFTDFLSVALAEIQAITITEDTLDLRAVA